MNPTEQGRFCNSCKKAVVDFTIIPIYKMNKQKAVSTSNLIKDFLVNEEGIGQERIPLADPQLNKDISSELIIHFEPKAFD